jgi:hypothetical protein
MSFNCLVKSVIMTETEEKLPSSMGSWEFASFAFDESIRVKSIIPLSCSGVGDSLSDPLEEWLEEEDDKEICAIFDPYAKNPEWNLSKYLEEAKKETKKFKEKWSDTKRDEEIGQWWIDNRIGGFLVTVETPIRDYRSNCWDKEKNKFTSCSYSWGHYTSQTFYTQDLNQDFIKQIKEWVDKMQKNWQDKALAKMKTEESATPEPVAE